MTNVVAMTSETAMAPLARWLLGVALVACIGQRDEAVFLLDPVFTTGKLAWRMQRCTSAGIEWP